MTRRTTDLAVASCAVFTAGCGGAATVASDAGVASDGAMVANDGAADASSDVVDAATADVGNAGCDGVRRPFWTWNLRVMPPPDVQVDAECHAARSHIYLYATDAVWGMRLDQAHADSIVRAFDESAPADPARGIYAIETAIYGEPPDLDGDPHVVLLYQDMGSFHGYTFDGFFRSLDETPDDPHSNAMEMLHVDAVRMDPTNEYMLGVVAHEFVHLLAFQYGDEDVWLSEMIAEAGMAATGYLGDVRLARTFAGHPTSPLVGNTAGMDYGPLFLFGDYLVERYGTAVIGDIARNRARGVPTVEAALSSRGGTFREVFGDWATANLVDAARPPYGYAAFDVSTEPSATTLTAGTAASGSVAAWTAGYARIDLDASATTADVTLQSSSSSSLVVRAAVYDPAARGDATVTSVALSGATTTASVPLPAGRRRLAVVVANPTSAAVPYTITVAAR